MEQRLRAIEDRLTVFETRLDGLAMREDVPAIEASVLRMEARMHRELHAHTWKLISVVGALFSGAVAFARLYHP